MCTPPAPPRAPTPTGDHDIMTDGSPPPSDHLFELVGRNHPDDSFNLLITVLETLHCAACVFEATTRDFLWCNTHSRQVFGYLPAELTGRNARILHIGDDEYEKFHALYEASVNAGRPWRGRYWLRRKSGEIFPTLHLITPVRPFGGHSVGVSLICDISPLGDASLGEAFDRLSRREKQVLDLTLSGLPSKEIAAKLGISHRTVETHRANMLHKLSRDSVFDIMAEMITAARADRFLG